MLASPAVVTVGSTRVFRTLAFAGYALAAVAATWPLAAELGTAVPGRSGDTGFYLWCMDTFWSELAAGSSPFTTDRVLVPLGAHLAGSNCVPALALLAWPFLASLPLYLGVLTLAAVALAGLGMLRLVETLGGDRAAAAVAGLAYAINPMFLSLIEYAHAPAVAAAALMPFGVRALVLFLRTASWWPLAVLSVLLWAMVFTHVYPTAAFLVTVVVVTLVAAPGTLTARHLRRGAVGALVNLALAAGFVATALPGDAIRELGRGGEAFTSTAVVDLVDTLVPGPRNPLLGGLHARWAYDRNGDVASYFVGWGMLVLAGFGLAGGPRRRERWAVAAAGVLTLVLAGGTAVRIAGVVLSSGAATPFSWLATLPLFELLDSPRRLVVGVALAVTALGGVGMTVLAARTGRRRLVIGGALVLVVLEFGQLGGTTVRLQLPAVYTRLAALPDSRTVLEMGGGLAASNMYLGLDWSVPAADFAFWQTRHRKPRVGGYLSRIPGTTLAWFQGAPIMGALLDLADQRRGTWAGTAYSALEIDQFLATFDLGYVVIPPSGRHEQYRTVVETLLRDHIASVVEDDGWRLYVLTGR
jgi:hypothetical protein